MIKPDPDGFYSIDEVLKLLNITNRQTLYNKIKKGKIKAHKTGQKWYFKGINIIKYLEGK